MADAVQPILCQSIQHSRLLNFAKDPKNLPYLYERFSFIRGAWHSKDCLFITDATSSKKRCAKCTNASNNIRYDRFPELYPERQTVQESSQDAEDVQAATEPRPTLPICELIFSNEDALRSRILQLVAEFEVSREIEPGKLSPDVDISTQSELALAARIFRVKEQFTFNLRNGKVFVVCNGDGCELCCVKNDRSNVGTTCKRCTGKKYDDKKYAARKRAHKEMRVASNSNVPMTSLDHSEQTQRMHNLNVDRKITNAKLDRALVKLAKQESKLVMSENMRKHAEKAMKQLANSKEAQQSLEERIYTILKELEKGGATSKNDPISRESSKRFVDEIVCHAKNWVRVEKGHNTAVEFNPSILGTAMSEYLRSPIAHRQTRDDGVLIQPSASFLKELKSQQQVKEGFCPEMCIIQPTYRGTGTTEWGQIGCDEMKMEFVRICSTMLPTEAMKNTKAGWPILGQVLGDILQQWLIDAVRNERRKKDPTLFQRNAIVSVGEEEIKSATNRIMGWAVKEVRNKQKDEKSAEYRLLSLMSCQEKEVDDAYFAKRYDLTTMLRNIGGKGGLTLVSDAFFDWGMKAMRIVTKELTEEDLEKQGETAIARAKKFVLNHASLKSDFALLCQRQQTRDPQLNVNYELASKVYSVVMTKVCNAKFGEVHGNYCQRNSLKDKGKINFRASLLATNGLASKVSEKTSGQTNDGTTVAAGTPTAAAVPTFAILSRGENGAVSETILQGKVFVLSGLFEEVHSYARTANDEIKKMIESFGGKVNGRFSKNTSKDADGGKIKDAQKRSVELINLRRLQKLLLGQLSFDSIKRLDRLTRDSFKGEAYQPAGAPEPPLAASIENTASAASN